MVLDMTRGKPRGLLLWFALPLMLSSLLQQTYTLCDSFIIGRLLGTEAFTASATASSLNWFPVSILQGFACGFGVTLAQSFGAGNREAFRKFFAGSILLSLFLGTVFTLVGVARAEAFLERLRTPEALMDPALRYIRVLWTGLFISALLNVLTSALLAIGDSRTPLAALTVSSLANIVLDLIFVGWFRLEVEGAALATVLAQAAAAFRSFRGLCRSREYLPGREHFRPEKRIYRELLRLGFPQGLCSGVTASGELIVQAAVNSFGVVFVTGLTASHRYLNLLNVVNYGMEGAVATYVGQNWGAGEHRRIREGTRSAIRMGLLTSSAVCIVVFFSAEHMIRFLIPEAAPEALRFGTQALRVQGLFLPSLYLLCEYRAAVHGMGNALIPMLSGFLELAMRIGCTLLLPLWIGQRGLYFTDAAAWVPTMALLLITYRVMRRKFLRTS